MNIAGKNIENSKGKRHCWKVLATSVTGTSHQKVGIPCQDAHSYEVLSGDVLITAVADGAGSAKYANLGSAIASKTAVKTIQARASSDSWPENDDGWKIFLKNSLEAAITALKKEAKNRSIELRDLSTTLILIIATPEIISVIQVGDGAVIVSDNKGNITALTKPQVGEYINETNFVTAPNVLDIAEIKVQHGSFVNIAVFSDGIERLALKFPRWEPYLPFFSPLFRFIRNETDDNELGKQFDSFFRSSKISDRTDDDLTFVLAALTG